MTFRKRRRFDRPLAESFGPDDGIDPRDWNKDDGPRPVRNRKSLQLCRQVEQALHLSLAGCGDVVLQSLQVISVQPFPDSSRLLVTIRTNDDGSEAERHLYAAAGLLRREVAAAIYRRKTPDLVFQVAASPC